MGRGSLKGTVLVGLGVIVLGISVLAGPVERRPTVVALDEVGRILKIQLDGRQWTRVGLPDAYYARTVGADPKGRYVFVNGGPQLMLFLDPEKLGEVREILKPCIPRRPWETPGLLKERETGFSSVYNGTWAVTPDGAKIYFSGEVPELQPTLVINAWTGKIVSRIQDFTLYDDTVFSPDGSLMFINHRKTGNIIAVDTRSDRIVKRIPCPPEYDGFRGAICLDSTGEGLLLVTHYSAEHHGDRKCLIRVDVNTGDVAKVMDDPYDGAHGDSAISTGGRYFVYNQYTPVRKRPNEYDRLFMGNITIVDLHSHERKTLSLREKYPPENWNLAVKLYMLPGAEEMVVVIEKIYVGPWNPKLRHRKLPQPWHLLLVDLEKGAVIRTIKIPDGGFRDLAFLSTD